MTRLILALAAAALLGDVTSASARILGGGNLAADCFLTFEGIDSLNERLIECKDGDVCDGDGVPDGRCTFGVHVCLCAADVVGCSSPTVVRVQNVKGARELVAAARAMLPASTPVCSPSTPVVVRLKDRGTRPGVRSVRMAAITDGRPRRDSDRFRLRCLPALP